MPWRWVVLLALSVACFGAKPAKHLSEDDLTQLATGMLDAIKGHDGNRVVSLLRKGADPNRSFSGTTPLAAAVFEEDSLVLRKLLDAGANPNLEIDLPSYLRGKGTALHMTACSPRTSLTRILLDHGAEADRDIDGRTPLSVAVQCDELAQYRLLKSRSNPLDQPTRKHHASIAAISRGMSLLQEFAKDSIVPDQDSLDLGLKLAAIYGDTAKMLKLLSLGSAVDIHRTNSYSPLMSAIHNLHKAAARILLERHASTSARGPKGETALMLASALKDTTILSWLLARDQNVEALDSNARNALFYASDESLPLLMRHKVPWNVHDKNGTSPLTQACANSHWKLAKALLDLRREAIDSSLDAQAALTHAVFAGEFELVQRLAKAKAPLNSVKPNSNTPLMTALWSIHLPTQAKMVELLLQNGADPNLAVERKHTPFQTALEKAQWLSLATLIAHGAEGDLASVSYRVIVAALENEDDSLLLALLKKGCDINGHDRPIAGVKRYRKEEIQFSGNPPLIHFIQKYKPETVKRLLALGAIPVVRDSIGVPALLRAISLYQIEIVEALLESGAQKDAKDLHGDGWAEYLKRFPYDEMRNLLKIPEARP